MRKIGVHMAQDKKSFVELWIIGEWKWGCYNEKASISSFHVWKFQADQYFSTTLTTFSERDAAQKPFLIQTPCTMGT